MRQTALRGTVGWQGKQLRLWNAPARGSSHIRVRRSNHGAGMAILASPCTRKNFQEGRPPQGWGRRKAKGYPEDTVALCRQKI